MQGQFRNLVCVAATLITLSTFVSPARADGADVLLPFPISGAYSAKFREDRERVSIIEFSGDYDKSLNSGEPNAEPRAVVAREFYRNHPDNYDFLVVFSTFDFERGDALAFHWPVQNRVKGIGKPEFDITHLFGSDGKLMGYTDMAALDGWVTDPMDPNFEEVLATLSHEILHQWGPKVRFREPDGTLSEGLLGRDGSHWSYLLDSDASVEYGADWRDNGNGTFTAVGTDTFYSPLDLYLMGLYRADEVPPMTLIANPEIDKTKLPEQGVAISGTPRTVTIEDIIAAEGPRVPDTQHSKKEFRMAFLLLTTPGEKVSEETIQGLNRIRNAFMTRFSVLTAGRAVAQIHPEATPVYETGAPTTVVAGELSSEAADLDAALQWLQLQQTGEGFWADKPATRVRDTAVTLGVLSRYSAGFQGLPVAAEWLAARELTNADGASRAQAVLIDGGFASGVDPQQLASLQNEDGGWGVAGGYASDPLDTALAVAALAREGASSGAIQAAVDYLSVTQNDDGGWSGAAGGPSRLSVTAEVLRALYAAERRDLPALDKALSWVASKQNGDGGFGDSVSTIHQSAAILIALTEHGALDRIQPDAAGQYLLDRQTVDGSWAGSSYATALAIAALKNFSFSNWKLESISTLPASPRDGERVLITGVVRNDSGLVTPEGLLRFYAGDPATGGVAMGPDLAIPRMPGGTALSFTTVWDSFGKPGTHTFVAVADPDASVVETSERDNSRSVQLEVSSAPEVADLEIVDADISFMPEHPNRLPTTLGVNAIVRNLGLQDAAGVRVLLWNGDVDTGTVVGETTVDIANRTAVAANFSYQLNRTGITRLTVQIDPDSAIAEAREDNNIASAQVVLEPSIDLSVSADDITRDRELVRLGDDLAFTVRLHNHGTSQSGSAAVRYSITDVNGTREVLSNSVDIAPGETVTHTVPARMTAPGPTTFAVELDSDGLIAELDETNNGAKMSFDVAAVEGPNLVVSAKNLRFTPDPANEAAPVLLQGTIRNSGTTVALDVAVAFYNGDPAKGGAELHRQIIPKIAAGEEAQVAFEWASVPDSADKLLFLVADVENLILEYDEEDNAAFNTLKVLSLPDLAVSDADIELSPTFPRVGEPVSISVRIANLGQQDAENVLVRAYDDQPQAGGSLVGERTVATLPAGGGTLLYFSTTFESERAGRPVVIQLDPEGRVLETNRGNNTAAHNVTVQNGDVYVTERYFSPNGDGVQDETELVFKLAQPATVAAHVVNAGGDIVRSFPDDNPITAGSILWRGLNDNGQVVADGDYRFRLVDESGATIAESIVTLDTNRLSVLRAMLEGNASYDNLTCDLATVPEVVFDDSGSRGFFSDGTSIYRLDADSGKAASLAAGAAPIAASPDGARVFFSRNGNQVWSVRANGGTPIQLGSSLQPLESLHVAGGGRYVIGSDGASLTRFSTDGFAAPVVLDQILNEYWADIGTGPFAVADDSVAYYDQWGVLLLIDIETRERVWAEYRGQPVYVYENFYGSLLPFSLNWSGDSSHVAASVWGGGWYGPPSELLIFGKDGKFRTGFEAATPYPGWSGVSWLSTDSLYAKHNSGKILHLDGSVEPTPFTGTTISEPGQKALLGPVNRDPMNVVFLDQVGELWPISTEIPPVGSGNTRFTTRGDLIYKGRDSNPRCNARAYDEWDYIRVRSHSNLSARFESEPTGGGFEFTGTASDKHFKHYYFEYAAAETPDEWNPAMPASGTPVVEGKLGFWIPPGRGAYIVRLTVKDLAGNSLTVSKRVYWGDPISISGLSIEPAVFSPNGDGVLDVSRIHYRVLKPVHLEFDIYNAAGDRVRSWVRDHSVIGSEEEIVWDGLDNYGVLLPDGEYTLHVQNYRFHLTIDTVSPASRIGVRDAYQQKKGSVLVDPGLTWEAADRHLQNLSVEVDDGSGWKASISPENARDEIGLELKDFADRRFRLRAVDSAGNSSVSGIAAGAEQLMVTHFGELKLKEGASDADTGSGCSVPLGDAVTGTDAAVWLPLSDNPLYVEKDKTSAIVRPGSLRISVAESVRSQLVQMFVQYRQGGTADWIDVPAEDYLLNFDRCAYNEGAAEYFETQSTAPDGTMELRWRPADALKPTTPYVMRLRGIDAAGNSHVSNVIGFYVSPFILEGLVSYAPLDDKKAVEEAAAELPEPWNPDREELLWGKNMLGESVGEIRLFLKSETDPRFEDWQLTDTVENPDEIFSGEIFIVRGRDLRACERYEARAIAYSTGGLFTEPTPMAISTLSFTLPCIEIRTEGVPLFPQACDEPSPEQSHLSLRPSSIDGSGLKLLTLSAVAPDGTKSLLYNINKPESGHSYSHLVDTSVMPDGTYFTATLVDVNDQVLTRPVRMQSGGLLQVDHSPPSQLDIVYPLEDQKVCGVPIRGSDGVVRNGIAVVADIFESGLWEASLELCASADSCSPSIQSPHALSSSGSGSKNFDPLFGLDGNATVQAKVYDAGGNVQCAIRSFDVDSTVEQVGASGDREFISPGTASEWNRVSISYRTGEAATVDVDIYGATFEDGKYVRNAAAVRSVLAAEPLLPGESSVAWDGYDDAGAVVPDGAYITVVSFRDGCGNMAEQEVLVRVDTSPPELAILSPAADESLSLVTEFRGNVLDPNLTGYSLSFGAGLSPGTWSPIASGEQQITDATLAMWNTYGLVGTYTVRLQAVDAAGNRAMVERAYEIPDRLNLLTGLEVTPAIFSPNGDQRADSVQIHIGIGDTVAVTARITAPDGTTVRTFDELTASTDVSLIWDGLGDDGVTVSDGSYRFDVTATSLANPEKVQMESVVVMVDSTAPLVEISTPASGFASGAIGVTGSIGDENIKQYSIELTDTPVEPVWREIAAGTANLADTTLAALQGLDEGEYAIRITAEDLAENLTEQIIAFRLDNTPPKVTLGSPADADVLSGTEASHGISASAVEAHPSYYSLEIGEGEVPAIWTEIAHGEYLPLPSPVASLASVDLLEQTYSLRLVVVDRAGNHGEDRVVFSVDATPPEVALLSPAEGSVIAGPVSVVGTANDENFKQYRLSIAPGTRETASRWESLAVGEGPVVGQSLLNWNVFPPDGQYVLKLEAIDAAGHSAETMLGVTVSVEPPKPPTGLAATLENRSDARLTWIASASTDILGYHVYRGAEQLTPEPLPGTEFFDIGLAEGLYDYRIRAVDFAGNLSLYTDPVEITVDLTPPAVRLSSPADGSIVGGSVDVSGTAGAYDFKEYRLFAGQGAEPEVWELVRRSPLPVSGGILGQWDTTGLNEGAVYSLKLEADDIAGNTGSDRVLVTVDNLAPAAPTGLLAVESGSDVELTWNANGGADLLGYLVFRNGELLGGEGAGLDLRPYALETVGYSDLSLADGVYEYTVAAIDGAGNVSPPSHPVKVSIDTRPPHAVITTPDNESAIDWAVYVRAESADTDIAEVLFQYRAEGALNWTEVQPDSAAPFESSFDPKMLQLVYGRYEIRAVASDLGGRIDPSPVPVVVTYKDLTRPDSPTGLSALVQGGEVALQWHANGEDDLAGYYVYRLSAEGEVVRINAEPVTTDTYTIGDQEDGSYSYYVTSVDTSGNESAVSAEVEAVVHTPALVQPYTPTLDSSVVVIGSSVVGGTVVTEIASSSGTQQSASLETAAGAEFALEADLQTGDNTFTVRIRDAAGNLSKPATVSVVRGEVPSQPTGLVGTAVDYQVSLSWNMNPEADIAGYRVFRDGNSVTGSREISELAATASHNVEEAESLFDADWNKWPMDTSAPADGQWIAIQWSESRLVTELAVQWAYNAPQAYDIQAWDGKAWITLKKIAGNDTLANVVELAAYYPTDRIRLVVREATNGFLLDDVSVRGLELNSVTTHSESRPDGVFTYTVTAVNVLGFESDHSAPAQVSVGDVTAPEPVELSAAASASNVQLSWSASSSPDVVRYDLYRDGKRITQINDLSHLSYLDEGLLNGGYVYTIRAVDEAGNESADSNEAAVLVDVALLPAPQNLAADARSVGDVALTWEPAPDSAPSGYRLLRSTSPGGPYSLVWEGEDRGYIDATGTLGVSYYYVVVALDGVGNSSVYSNEVSAVPRDLIAPVAPDITYPVTGADPYGTEAGAITLAGHSEPGTLVQLMRNGAVAGSTTALADMESSVCSIPDQKQAVMVSPDGRYIAYSVSSGIYVCDAAVGTSAAVIPGSGLAFMHWLPDSAGFVYVSGTTVERYDLVTRSATILKSYANAGWLSPDGSKLFYFSAGYWGYGKIYDLETGQISSVTSPSGIYKPTVRWSPDGRYIAYSRWGKYELIDVLAFTVKQIGYGQDIPQWADGGASLLLTESGDITSYSVADGAKEIVLTIPGKSASAPMLSPREQYLAYFVDGESLWRVDLVTGEKVQVHDNELVEPWFVQWTDSGYIAFVSKGKMKRLSLPGHFRFDGIGLDVGDNLFTATAEDDAGNISPTSNEILARRAVPELPDLTIESAAVTLMPSTAIAGESVRITAVVENVGTAASPGTDFSAIMVAEDGSAVSLLDRKSMLGIQAGDSRSISFDWTAEKGGTYTLVLLVDRDDLVEELDEINNVAVKQIPAANDAGPQVSLNLDGTHYEANGDARLTSAWTSYDGDFAGRLEVFIADENGYLVTEVRDIAVGGSTYGEPVTYEDTWNVGSTFAGTYVARARLLSTDGAVIGRDSAEFTIVPSATIEMGVNSDSAAYGAHALVRAESTFEYTSGNRLLADAVAGIRVSGPDGAVLAQSENRLGDLLPGTGGELVLDWPTETKAPGIYTITAELAVAGEPFASAASAFEILPDGTHFTGTLQTEALVGIGDQLEISYGVTNLGNIDVTGLPLRIALVDPYGPEMAAVEKTVDIELGASVQGQVAFSTAELELKRYSIVLQQGAANTVLVRESVSVADLTPPQVEIVTPAEGAYVGKQGEAAIRASDAHTRVEQVEFRIDGGEWTSAPRDSSSGLYRRPLPSLTEGEHTLEARAEDQPGNVGTAGIHAFVVDTTAPDSVIEGVEAGAFYNVDVAPRVTVTDAALAEYRLSLNGEAFSSGASVSEEGEYTLAVYAEDKAGNIAEQSLTFTIDKTTPKVTIGGVAAGEIYNHQVTPSVDVDDANPGQLKLTLNGEPYEAGTPIVEEGFHRFEATAIDRAGNSASETVMFTIDTTPPAITVVFPENELTTRERSIHIEGLTEAASSVALVTAAVESATLADLEGQFFFADVPLVIGRNAIALTATDRAGNVGETYLLYVNVLPPVELEGYVRAPRSVLLWVPTGGSEPESRSVAFIESALAEKGYAYETTYSETAFIEALRTQRFSAALVLEPHRSAEKKDLRLKVSEELDAELRLMTASGTGVIWIKTQPDARERWEDLFGMQALGSLPQVSAVAFSGERLTRAGTWALNGRAMKVRTTGGAAVGSLLPAEAAPALVLNRYGEGTAALVAFDPAEMGDAEAAKDVLAEIVGLVSPGQRRLLPGSFTEIIWLATEVDPPLDVQLDEHLASGMRFLEVGDGTIVSLRDATWQRTIREPVSEPFAALVRLGDTIGTYPVRATVSLLLDGVPSYPEEEYLFLEVSDDIASLQAAALSRLENLAVAAQDERRLGNALADIRSALRENTADREGVERAISSLLSAEMELMAMSRPYRDAEAAVGALLRSYQLLESDMD